MLKAQTNKYTPRAIFQFSRYSKINEKIVRTKAKNLIGFINLKMENTRHVSPYVLAMAMR